MGYSVLTGDNIVNIIPVDNNTNKNRFRVQEETMTFNNVATYPAIVDLSEYQVVILRDLIDLDDEDHKVKTCVRKYKYNLKRWTVVLSNSKFPPLLERNPNFPFSMDKLEILVQDLVTILAIPNIKEYMETCPELYQRIVRAVWLSNYRMRDDEREEKRDFLEIRRMKKIEKIEHGLNLEGEQTQIVIERRDNSSLIVQKALENRLRKERIDISLDGFALSYYKVLSKIKVSDYINCSCY